MATTPPPPPAPPLPPRPASTRGLASWVSRAAAWLLDGVVAAAPTVLAVGVAGATGRRQDGTWFGLVLAGYLATIAVAAWNMGWRQGTTGQSLGKSALGIAVVSAEDGRPIGVGLGLARWLVAGFLGGLCLLDYLWPLWDERNRAWHDMVLDTSVVVA